ncbi:MAG TPA: hypothetical protein VLX92_34360 [Kofleriaceae bacterium]|nr:hypothetical protein [Kofleriaceae bacterium]
MWTSIFAAAYAAAVAWSIGRAVWRGVREARAYAVVEDIERKLKAEATRVRIAGVPGARVRLGHGKRVFDMVALESAGFDLVTAAGATIAIAPGARIDVMASALAHDRDACGWLAAGSELLLIAPEQRRDGGPFHAPGAAAVVRGDAALLFDRDAVLFSSRRLSAALSWPRVGALVAVHGLVLAMALRGAPDTAWNAPLFLLGGLVVIDLVFARGRLTMMLCSRLREPGAFERAWRRS